MRSPPCSPAASCLLSQPASPHWSLCAAGCVVACVWGLRVRPWGMGARGASDPRELPALWAWGLPAPQTLSGLRQGSLQADVLSGGLGWGREKGLPFP